MLRAKLRWLAFLLLPLGLAAAGLYALPAPQEGGAKGADKADPDAPVAYVGARIHTAAGQPIDDGVLLVRKGKIVGVGPRKAVAIPAGAVVRDLSGKVIIPGL